MDQLPKKITVAKEKAAGKYLFKNFDDFSFLFSGISPDANKNIFGAKHRKYYFH